ncbi:Flp family type IVb pilin [Bilifractor sp. HCP3S3_D3]
MNRFLEEDGQGMVEYALIIALIAVVCIVAFTVIGQSVKHKGGRRQ